MPEPFSNAPSPVRVLLERIDPARQPPPVVETVARAAVWKHLLQDYRPVADSLEWQLSRLAWNHDGALSFVKGGVPYIVNNDGRLSRDAAAVLFANCEEADTRDGAIRVLELGAGTGLFARYFLDEFRDLCLRSSRDYYDRISYSVTDGSPRTVDQWRELGIFQEHGTHAPVRVLEAADAGAAGPVRAVFCNYVLDVLPMAFLMRTADGWRQLCVRTWITGETDLLRQYTPLTSDEILAAAASGDPQARQQLLPLFPLLECEADFLPVGEEAPPGLTDLEETCGVPFAYNYGAIACLESLASVLESRGFMLINDYGPGQPEGLSGYSPGQRFGPVVAGMVNLPQIEARLQHRGLETWEPDGDAGRSVHTRLFSRGGLPGTQHAFESRFRAAALEQAEAPVHQARRQAAAGLLPQALAGYRAAIERNPRNWQVIGEAAAFVSGALKDPRTGLDLARAAIELNPWFSPFLWCVLGDCLSAIGRAADAHECYLQAWRIHPDSPEVNLNLAGSWLRLGNPRRSLEAVARGLANDSNAMLRHVLLQHQQQAIDALSVRWNAECATAARRSGKIG